MRQQAKQEQEQEQDEVRRIHTVQREEEAMDASSEGETGLDDPVTEFIGRRSEAGEGLTQRDQVDELSAAEQAELLKIYREWAWEEQSAKYIKAINATLNEVLLGKQMVVRRCVSALLAGGHVLLEDVPGVGKTLLARAIAKVMGGEFKRIQFTADMLPADVVGGLIWDARQQEMIFRPGPVVAHVVLADEMNRTPPRTQSALLEAMEERSVSADGQTMPLPKPWMLIATQNPLHDAGTYPLPSAQMDRFMMRLTIGYPSQADEEEMLRLASETSSDDPVEEMRAVVTPEDWLRLQKTVQAVYIHPDLRRYVVQVAAATRSCEELSLGISPRGTRDWVRAAKAYALTGGRQYVLPQDLKEIAHAVLTHRLALTDDYGSYDEQTVLTRILAEVAVPQPRPSMEILPAGAGADKRQDAG
jgi:MoxR-like ATPase